MRIPPEIDPETAVWQSELPNQIITQPSESGLKSPGLGTGLQRGHNHRRHPTAPATYEAQAVAQEHALQKCGRRAGEGDIPPPHLTQVREPMPTETLEKHAPVLPTEESLRAQLRAQARGSYTDQEVPLSAEVVGLACEVTGISSPAQAIEELVTDALDRWAQAQAFERLASTLNFGDDEGALPESSRVLKKSAPRRKPAGRSR